MKRHNEVVCDMLGLYIAYIGYDSQSQVGKKSQCFPWQGVQYVADHIPSAKGIVYEEGDHWLYIEEADTFAQQVMDFAIVGLLGTA